MKDGKVAHQGTFDDIQEEEPEIYSGFQKALSAATDTETDTDVELEINRERMALQRQISKRVIEEESRHRTTTALDDSSS